MNYRPALNMPPVVKNLILANVLFYIATIVLKQAGIDLYSILGLYFPLSEKFRLHQIFTYMFMHSTPGFGHIFFQYVLRCICLAGCWKACGGPKRFLIFYLVTGVGAAVLQLIVTYIEYKVAVAQIAPDPTNLF